jgi:S-adenosylmethionine:tRNA ribosyltransferase-isomerase
VRPSFPIELFDYHLPDGLIAQRPAPERRGSRLFHLCRGDGAPRHLRFPDLVHLLRPGDLLVLNDTRVFRARLEARRTPGGKVELFLLAYPAAAGSAPCLLRPAARVHDGETLILADGTAVRVRRMKGTGEGEGEGERGEGFVAEAAPGALAGAAETAGRVPLPPYIKRGGEDEPLDAERYQTVYAARTGAVAAPTAGLHFDAGMLDALRAAGVETAFLTLHVGAGTFAPVRVSDMALHRMHEESYEVPEATAKAVARAKADGRRVVAVGTTVVRALESAALAAQSARAPAVLSTASPSAATTETIRSGSGRTSLLILPGFSFQVVDALLTNFHLPRSTLLALVAAFAGRERVLAAYDTAVRESYRFFSYGDAMFID